MSARYKNRKYQIPKDWAWRKIEDIAFVLSGSTPKGLNNQASSELEEFPFYKVSDMNNEGNQIKMNVSNLYLNETQVKKLGVKIHPQDTIIFPKRGGAILTNKKRLLSRPAGYDLNLMGLKTQHFGVRDLYLWYWFQRINLSRLYDGSNVPQINNKDIAPLFFPIAPLPEQRAIVAKIEQLFSELDNGIANLKAAKDKLEIYRQAVLKKAFEGELTKDWREQQSNLPTADELLEQIKEERLKHYENQLTEWDQEVANWEANGKQGRKPSKPPKLNIELKLNQHESQKLIDLPETYWTYINIDFASSKLGDGLHGTPKYSDGDFYFINGNNLQDGKIIFKHDTKKVSQEEALKHYRELTDRTVLVSINGTLGNIAFYNNENIMLGKSACYFNLLSPINKSFIRWLIESHEFRNYAFKTATGTTIKNVPLKAMRNFIFPLCSEKEQTQTVQEIESRLSVCDNILANIEGGLEKCEALRQSILKQAFEGKLLSEEELKACRQEPDWEPAEKLLERIKNGDKVESNKVSHA